MHNIYGLKDLNHNKIRGGLLIHCPQGLMSLWYKNTSLEEGYLTILAIGLGLIMQLDFSSNSLEEK